MNNLENEVINKINEIKHSSENNKKLTNDDYAVLFIASLLESNHAKDTK